MENPLLSISGDFFSVNVIKMLDLSKHYQTACYYRATLCIISHMLSIEWWHF